MANIEMEKGTSQSICTSYSGNTVAMQWSGIPLLCILIYISPVSDILQLAQNCLYLGWVGQEELAEVRLAKGTGRKSGQVTWKSFTKSEHCLRLPVCT